MASLFDQDKIIKKSLKKHASDVVSNKKSLNNNDIFFGNDSELVDNSNSDTFLTGTPNQNKNQNQNQNQNDLNRTFETPMMVQYQNLKKLHNDCLLFFRLGDFYEMFMNDAIIASKVLNITLTKRERGKDGKIPMAGIPFHAVDSYLVKLVKNGYKIAIAEQVGDITGKELVTREIVRIVTPGTLLNESSLDKKENNYIISIYLDKKSFGLAISDISTGNFYTEEYDLTELANIINNELIKYNPTECILPKSLYDDPTFLKLLSVHKDLNIYPFYEFDTFVNNCDQTVKDHFKIKSLKSFNIEHKKQAVKASSALLGYLKHTQKSNVSHIKNILEIQNSNTVGINRATITNLELFSTIKEGSKKGTLLYYLDQTTTAMGARLLKNWLIKPITNQNELNDRYENINYYIKNDTIKNKSLDLLKGISDIERLLSKISFNVANPRDVDNLSYSLKNSIELLKINSQCGFLNITNKYDDLLNLVTHINKSLINDPPLDAKSGGFIKKGISSKLDELNKTIFDTKGLISKLEDQEKQKTGISSLKIKFNQVFGYYIEITKSNLSLVPKHYIRKQTMVNAERFITDDLKKHEEIILSAQQIAKQIEYDMFLDLCQTINNLSSEIQNLASDVAKIDCLISFSSLAVENNLTRPIIKNNGVIKIVKNRHPVVESILDHKEFVSNDVYLDSKNNQLLIITGPNMAGKSVYLRQVAITLIMAQIGCFVPAEIAEISLVDNIFVRSGASDIITAGLSTFMVEMVETASILNNATDNSLVIMDEIGRGTSTYDGISIAWSIAEYLVKHGQSRPKTLFATHYHELTKLEQTYPNSIKNFHFPATEYNGEPVFLHTLKVGGASSSFGIQVAKIAGLPKQVYQNAQDILDELQKQKSEVINYKSSTKLQTSDLQNNLIQQIKSIDTNKITPLQALIKLQEIKDLI